MLDIKYIINNTAEVKKAVQNKNVTLDVDELLRIHKERNEILQQIEQLNQQRKQNAELAGQTKGKPSDEAIAAGKKIKVELEKLNPTFNELEVRYQEMMQSVPNIYSADTPIGPDESANKVIRSVGSKPHFDFKPKEHWELGNNLKLINTEKAAEITGARFVYLMGDLVLLQQAIITLTYTTVTNETTLQTIANKNGLKVSTKPFKLVIPPVFIRPEVMQRMGRLEPREERYHIAQDDLYLIGSAEHTLGPLHMNETIAEESLPIRYAGFSSAFRREAGSYGQDTKGILRLHQFDKIELESFTTAEQGEAEQNFIVAIQEYLLQQLELPYQVVQISTGDMGKPDYRQIDMETWMPGQNSHRETHTSDYMTSYQALRLQTKVKRTSGETEYVHMNDATAFALGRTIIAIMENYQQADGRIKVPKVLQPLMGKEIIG